MELPLYPASHYTVQATQRKWNREHTAPYASKILAHCTKALDSLYLLRYYDGTVNRLLTGDPRASFEQPPVYHYLTDGFASARRMLNLADSILLHFEPSRASTYQHHPLPYFAQSSASAKAIIPPNANLMSSLPAVRQLCADFRLSVSSLDRYDVITSLHDHTFDSEVHELEENQPATYAEAFNTLHSIHLNIRGILRSLDPEHLVAEWAPPPLPSNPDFRTSSTQRARGWGHRG